MDFKSTLTNCVIISKEDQEGPMFCKNENGEVLCNLDGYTILPNEEYRALKK